jgi:hypothetical protein
MATLATSQHGNQGATFLSFHTIVAVSQNTIFIIFSRERSSTGSNDCFVVVVVVVGIFIL